MACSCGNLQCYICGENVKGYGHFNPDTTTCPLYGDSKLQTKVMKAGAAAIEEALRKDGRLREEDLRVDGIRGCRPEF